MKTKANRKFKIENNFSIKINLYHETVYSFVFIKTFITKIVIVNCNS